MLEAARELRYEPHAAARGLRRAETGALGTPHPGPRRSRLRADGARRRAARARARDGGAARRGSRLEVAEEIYAGLVRTGRIDGLIVASMRRAAPVRHAPGRAGIPHVFVNRAVPGSGRNVTMDDEALAACAVRYLHELGHTRIGFLGGPRMNDPSTRRVARLPTAVGRARPREGDRDRQGRLPRAERRPTGPRPPARPSRPDRRHHRRAAAGDRCVPRRLGARAGDPAAALDRQLRRPTRSRLPSALPDRDPHAVRARSAQPASTRSSTSSSGEPPHDVVIPTKPRIRARGSTSPRRS